MLAFMSRQKKHKVMGTDQLIQLELKKYYKKIKVPFIWHKLLGRIFLCVCLKVIFNMDLFIFCLLNKCTHI